MAPEESHAGGHMKRQSATADSHHGHTHGAAHFQDIDDRLGTSLEADGVPGGGDDVDGTRFHGAHQTQANALDAPRPTRPTPQRTAPKRASEARQPAACG